MSERVDTPAEQQGTEHYARYRERLAAYKSVNETLQDLHWNLEELEEQINHLSTEQTADQQEAARIAGRINDLRIWKNDLEERIIQKMLLADELAAQLAHDRRLIEQP